MKFLLSSGSHPESGSRLGSWDTMGTVSRSGLEVIVEVSEVQDNFLSYPFSSAIWHIYKLGYRMAAVFIVLQILM